MPEQPAPDRFKPEMPKIPGVSGERPRSLSRRNLMGRFAAAILFVLLGLLLGARWALRPKQSGPAKPPPQIEVPAPEPDPNAALPRATESEPVIATVGELARLWSSKRFFYRNRLTGENVQALLVRLPTGSGRKATGYWAFSLSSPSGNCQLEYITDFRKLRIEYGYRAADHPMVGNPCSRTVVDPLKLTNVPGNVWVRGAIVQGSGLRPPLGIEVKVQGKKILAVRME